MNKKNNDIEQAHRDGFLAALADLACPGGRGHRFANKSSAPASKCRKCVESFFGKRARAKKRRREKAGGGAP